jgi:uncharacterized YccA/Bax inhibitor family protein
VDSYNDFFAGTATVAGALIGLLFVALSIQPERNRDERSVEHRAVAGTAFTALLDALFTSLIGLQPGAGLQYGAVIFGALGVFSSVNLARRIWQVRGQVELSRRWSTFMGFIILMYAAQLAIGLWPNVSVATQDSYTAGFLYAMFSVGIGRSWELLGMQRSSSFIDQVRDALTHNLTHTQAPPKPADPATPDDPS